jgi:hypothetical protein
MHPPPWPPAALAAGTPTDRATIAANAALTNNRLMVQTPWWIGHLPT